MRVNLLNNQHPQETTGVPNGGEYINWISKLKLLKQQQQEQVAGVCKYNYSYTIFTACQVIYAVQ